MNQLKMGDQGIEDITAILNELQEDATVPKNVRTKIQGIVEMLKSDSAVSIKVNKALNELDEITSDVNLQPYTRTQIWNVVSLLEKMQ